MKVLFVHGNQLVKDSNNNYYDTTFTNEAFERYFNIAENVTVVMRANLLSDEKKLSNYSKITLENLKIREVPNMNSISGQIKNRQKVKQVLKEEINNADYIVVRLPSMVGMLAYDIAKKNNKPCLIELVGCPWDALWNHSFKGKIIAPYMYNGTKKRVKNAEFVVYVTNEFLQKRYPTNGKEENISNVSLTDFSEDIIDKRIKKIKNKKSTEKIIIGTTAAIDVRYKGQQYIIQALGELKEKGMTNYEYQLVGGGDKSYLLDLAQKNNVEDQVKFLGPLPHEKVFEWLETIDIYAQPSKQEGLPRALIESMSRGLPAFGAETAGIPELLAPEYIFKHGKKSTTRIAEMILSFDKKIMLEQSKANYEESKKYSRNIIKEKRRHFFREFRESISKE